MDTLRKHLKDLDWSRALTLLVDQWRAVLDGLESLDAAQRVSHFGDTLGPWLAECFQPIPGREQTCTLFHAAKQDPVNAQAAILEIPELVEQTRENCLPEAIRETSPFLQSLALRAETLNLARFSSDGESAIKDQLQGLLESYRRLWSTDVWTKLLDLELAKKSIMDWSRRPAMFAALKQSKPHFANWLDEFVSADTGIGWYDPAVTFLADSLLEASGHSLPVRSQPKQSSIGRTWVLIAVDDRLRLNPEPTGLLLALRVETILGGCGVWSPHPDHATHVIPDRQFQIALRNAWQVAIGHRQPADPALQCDYRWSLTVIDDSNEVKLAREERQDEAEQGSIYRHKRRHLVMLHPLSGRSGEVALTAGLCSAADEVPLDLTRAATAMFSGDLPANANPVLESVLSVRQKQLGLREVAESLSRSLYEAEIAELVVEPTQTEAADLGKKKLDAADFETAFDLLSLHAGITADYHAAVFRMTTDWFGKNCFGEGENPEKRRGSYILNRLRRRPGPSQSPDDRDLLIEIKPEQFVLDCLLQALPQKGDNRLTRFQVVADSGIGKTSLLVYIADQICEADGGLVPIRIEHLSELLDRTTREHWVDMAVANVATILGDSNSNDRDVLKDWLTRKVNHGQVVWLLDALDQTSAHRERMTSFVKEFPRCPVVLTMRPDSESEFGRQITDSATRWTVLDLLPFSREDSQAYMGEYADLFFNRLPITDRRDDSKENLLTIPLLLHLLKELAVRSDMAPDADPETLKLPQFKNRYAIYQAVMNDKNGLISKGWESLKHREQEVTRTIGEWDDALEKVQQLAFEQARLHHFDTLLKGTFYRNVKRNVQFNGSETATALRQLNVVTQMPTFDDVRNGGMKWRHRSFLEFFAGCRLAELFAVESTRDDALKVLRDIQEVLNENREFKTWKTIDSNGKPRQVFRDLPSIWHWVLRFALAHAETIDREVSGQLALTLVQFNNPWIVFRAIRNDKLGFGSAVEKTVFWLVHLYRSDVEDFTTALESTSCNTTPESTNSGNSTSLELCIADFLQPAMREAESLTAFLGLHDHENATVTSLIPPVAALSTRSDLGRAARSAYSSRSRNSDAVIETFRDRFVPMPVSYNTRFNRTVEISEFFVTNDLFEVFCPTHRRRRSSASHHDDQPTVHVTFFMACEFCLWLTDVLSDEWTYRLPQMRDWQWSVHWGHHDRHFWWGNKALPHMTWNSAISRNATRRYSDSKQFSSELPDSHWHNCRMLGTAIEPLDTLGNVWTWSLHNPDGEERIAVWGGSFRCALQSWRKARQLRVPTVASDDCGFSVVRESASN